MKRKLALLLCLAMLTGCADEASAPAEPTAEAQTHESADTHEVPDTTEEAVTDTQHGGTPVVQPEAEKKPTSLYECRYTDLTRFDPHIEENGQLLVDIDGTVPDEMHYIASYDSMVFDYDTVGVYVRSSSRALKSSPAELEAMVSTEQYDNSKYYADTAYDIKWRDPVLYLDFTDEIRAQSWRFSYNIYDSFSLNAFIKKTDEGYHVIIDPAYMYGLPVFSNLTERMTYNINGNVIYADTMDFIYQPTRQDAWLQDEIGEDGYVYARIDIGGISVVYDTAEGYLSSGDIDSAEILSTDTGTVIGGTYLFEGEGKDPEMTEVYNAIISGLDGSYTEDTVGISLLDLDFDGTPELLVSTPEDIPDDNNYWLDRYGCEVDIYRIEDSKLKFIDTINTVQTFGGGNSGHNLGIKTLEDGSKAWFGISSIDRSTEKRFTTAYLYTLKGDTLKSTEVFSHRDDGYYYMGEKMVFSEIKNENFDPEADYYDSEYLTVWGDYSSTLGGMHIYDSVRSDFCYDIEQIYTLYTDWLSTAAKNQYNSPATWEQYDLTDRELSYNIAYLVDSFYLGHYDSELLNYKYYFDGGYAKPVIYLYPEETTEVSVEVGFTSGGRLTCTYPEYDSGWSVTAHPDGTLFDNDGNEYYCLYWEGEGSASYDMSRGWCVAGEDTADFLREKLIYIGLTPREANEFIIYWLPIMQENKYNVISFHTDEYVSEVPLTVSPAPDTQIRVFMTYAASDAAIEIQPQELPQYQRNGFTLVEWGGGAAG